LKDQINFQGNIILAKKLVLINIALLFIAWVTPITDLEANEPKDPFIEGYTAYVLKDFNLAMNYWKPMAINGFSDAQYLLGVMYANGQGVMTDFQKAAYWFLESARQGDVGAQFFLGTLLREGKGMDRDLFKAGEWFQKAAEQGYPDAQFQIGKMYASGNGKPKDFIKAYCWMKLAGNNGIQLAQEKSKRIANFLSKEELDKADKMAATLWIRLEKRQ
jgi:TPR repeat protein